MSICKELGEPVSLECILRNDAVMSDSSLDSRSMFASVKFSEFALIVQSQKYHFKACGPQIELRNIKKTLKTSSIPIPRPQAMGRHSGKPAARSTG